MITVIGSQRRVLTRDLRELWEYRDLLLAFGRRDVVVRYKQTFIGVAWAVLQPLLTMAIYTITFGKFAKMPSDGIPYPIFSYTGLLFWTLFSSSLTNAADSLVANEGIVKKVYFPRLVTPLASTVVSVVDFGCALLCLAGLTAYYGVKPSLLGILLIPALALWSLFASLGLGWFLAALNVQYRDVRHALPFFIQLLVFVSPVIYPAHIFGKYTWVLALNPMTGVIESARYLLLGAGTVDTSVIATSFGASLVFLLVGFFYFQHVERTLADTL